MKLSVIIVNYNVRYFLQNCLISVKQAIEHIDAEVIVVDNNSVDGSVEMLRNEFPEIKTISNKKNLGFSKANNQAIREANGEFILLLNPDTVVEKDTFEKCIRFMEERPDCGGLGVRMVDGSGTYLPESKRGLPTPKVAFYKIFGLSALFPKSEEFGRYHLGYIPEYQTSEIEILSGAFMFLRKETLDKTGVLDEKFFMYGEDIDLSWRIVKAGYKNYYFPETQIIHYKGESTKKSSVNYVFVFYRAMVIFAQKHFSKNNANLFSVFINLAIYFRATLAILQRFFRRIALPVVDFALLFACMYVLKDIYEKKIRFTQGGGFPEDIILFSLPLIAGIYVLTNALFGVYREPSKINKLLRGLSAGTIAILITYALLDESYRFSRALVISYTLLSFLLLPISRSVLLFLGLIKKPASMAKRIAIVGLMDEIERVKNLLIESGIQIEKIVRIDPSSTIEEYRHNYDGKLSQLNDLKLIYDINECIFCSRDVTVNEIIRGMSADRYPSDYKIAPPGSDYIIGSSSNETSGEYYVVGKNSISRGSNKRKKRLLDVVISTLLLLISPFVMVLFEKPSNFVVNIWNVLRNKTTLVSLPDNYDDLRRSLKLKKGILSPLNLQHPTSTESEKQLITQYTKQYAVWKDIECVFRAFKKLDN